MKKSFLIFLCVMMCLFAFSAGICAATPAAWDGSVDTSWYDAEKSSFELNTPKQLAGLAAIVNGTAEGIEKDSFDGKSVTLTAALDMGGVKGADGTWSGQSWTPIGNSTSVTFRGTFNANGKAISNLYVNSENNYVGLFGAIDSNALVKNLILASGSIASSGSYVGGITGYMGGNAVVYNCGNSADVTGADYVGGIAGRMNGTQVQVYKVFNAGDVKTSKNGGGIVGYVQTSIFNAYNTGDVDNVGTNTAAPVGGIAGTANNSMSTSLIDFTNCYSSGKVTSIEGASNCGLMVGLGWVKSWKVIYCTFTNCYYEKSVDGMYALGGDTVERDGTTGKSAAEMKQMASALGSEFAADDEKAPANGGYPVLAWQVKKADGSYSFVENWSDYATASYAAGDGTYENPYQISNAGELALLIKDTSANKTNGFYYKQTADIDLSDNLWNCIGSGAGTKSFRGSYDGGNFTISNLYANTSSSNVGLFGYVQSADIINVKLANVDIHGGSNVGALIGYSNGGDIANCHVLSGAVTGSSTVGGLVGTFYPVGTINQILAPDYIMDSSASADVTAGSWVGGLVGAINKGIMSTQTGTGRMGNVLIRNCFTTGNVTVTATHNGGHAGGLVGINNAVKRVLIENCYVSGSITASENCIGTVGGLVGNSGFGTNGVSDDALYANNVVLSAAISGTNETAPAGRITGLGQNSASALSVALENNYALDTMTIHGVTVESNDAASYNGGSLSAEQLCEEATWESLGFDFSSTGSWQWDEVAKRPVLKGTALKSYPLVIKTQPHDATAYLNREVLFRTEAGKGTGDLTYTWQMSSDNGKTWSAVGTGTELTCKGRLSWDGNLIRCQIRDSKETVAYTDTVVLSVVESDYTATVAANELYSLYQQGIVSTAKAPTALYGISGDISDQDILLYYQNHYDVASILTGKGMRPWAAIDWMAQGNDPTSYLLAGDTTANAEETDLIASYLQMQNELGTGAFTNGNGTQDKDYIMSNLYYFLALDIYYQGADTWGNENEEGTTGRNAAIEYLLSLMQTDTATGCKYYFNNFTGVNYIPYGLNTRPFTVITYAADFVTVMSRLADDPVYGKTVRGIIYDSMDYLAADFEKNGASKSNTMCSAKYLSALVAAANVANSDALVKTYTEQMEVVFDNILNARAFDGTYSLLTDTGYYTTGEILPEKTGVADTTAAVAMAFGDYAKGSAVLADMNYERSDWEFLNFDMNQIEVPSVVLSDLELPATGLNGTVFIWSSSNENVISVAGKVNRPEVDAVVTLTVKGVYGSAEAERSFTVTVSANRGEGGDEVFADAENISLLPEYLYDIELPAEGTNGSVITWASSDEKVISADGKLTRPAIGEKDANVTLTATVTKGDISETRTFDIKVWANVDTATNEGMVKEAYYQIRNGCMKKKVLSDYWEVWTAYGALGEDLDKFDLIYSPGSMGTSSGGNILAIMCMGDNPYNCNGKNFIARLAEEGFNASWSEPVFRTMAAEAAGMDDPRISVNSSLSWLKTIDSGTDIAGWTSVPVSRHVDDSEENREITQKYINMISETMSGPTSDTTVSMGCVVSGLSAFYAAGLEFEGIEGLDVTKDEPWVSMEPIPNMYRYIEKSFGSSASGFGGQICMEFVDLYNTLYKDGNVGWITCGVSKDKLDTQIEKANAILKDKDNYTEDSIKDIEDALKAVDEISEDDLNAKIPTWGETYYTLYDAVRYAKTTNAPVVDEVALQAAKDAAVKEVEEAFAAYDSDDYSATNWDKLVAEKDNALTLIANAADENAVAERKNYAIEAMAAIPVSSDADKIEVSFRLIGATRSTENVDFSVAPGEYYGSEYQNWIKTTTYKVDRGSCVYDVLMKALKEHGMTQTGGSAGYVSHITAPAVLGGESLGEFDNGPNSGWMYTINGLHPSFGVKEMILNDGDSLVFHYVNDFKYEDESTNPTSEYLNKWLEVSDVEPGTEEDPGVDVVDPSELPFEDLTEDWYKEAIAYVYSYELMNGTSDSAFEPQTTLNRAMMATILYRIEGEPAVKAENPFGDVKNDIDGKWYYNAVLWASQNGIVEGYEDDTFRPVREITREEMAVMMYRYAEFKGMDMTATADFAKFSDGTTVNEWAKSAMSWAVGVNLIAGHDNGTLEPQGTATRAQAATVLMRFNELIK